MAYIFSSIPFMKGLMAYWYHFAIMFEAVFILTAVDAGTRVGRYLLQEMIGKVSPKFLDNKWTPGVAITSLIFTSAWGYLVYTGDITTIWPLFGMSNQLLATCALIVGTTMLIRLGKARYAWVTAVPGIFMIPVTMTAGYQNITKNFLPKGLYLLVVLSIVLMVLMTIVFISAFLRWFKLLQVKERVEDAYGESVLETVEEGRVSYTSLPAQE
jgi:carbon starvation protein